MLWTEADSSLPNNYFSALVQLKSLERRLDKDPEMKQHYARKIHDNFNKGYITQVDKSDCFKLDQPREWYLPPHHPVVHPLKTRQSSQSIEWRSKVPGAIFEQRFVNRTGPATKFDTHTDPLLSTQVRRLC